METELNNFHRKTVSCEWIHLHIFANIHRVGNNFHGYPIAFPRGQLPSIIECIPNEILKIIFFLMLNLLKSGKQESHTDCLPEDNFHPKLDHLMEF